MSVAFLETACQDKSRSKWKDLKCFHTDGNWTHLLLQGRTMSKAFQTAKRVYQAGNKLSLSALLERKSFANVYSRRFFATETEHQAHQGHKRLTWRDFREGRCNLDELANDNRHIGVYIVLSIYVVVGVTLKKVFGGKKKSTTEEAISVDQSEVAPAQ